MKEFKKKLLKKLETGKKLNKEENEYAELVLGRPICCDICKFNLANYL